MAPVPYTQLALGKDVDAGRKCRERNDFPNDPVDWRRITRFAPLPVDDMAPVLCTATDARLLRALAVSGTSWVNRDGRVIAKGTTWDNDALLSLPETAVLVAVQLRLGQERTYEYDVPDDRIEEAIAAVEPDMMDLHDPIFHERLHAAGWMRVDLCRDREVRTMGTWIRGRLLDDFSTHLTGMADALGCRLLSGYVGGETRLLYDPVETKDMPFAPGFVGYRQGLAEPPSPRWPRVPANRDDEGCERNVGFGM